MGLVKEGLLAVVSGDLMEEQAEARLECSKVEGRLRDGQNPAQGTAPFAGVPRRSRIRQNLERAKCLREVLERKHLGALRAAGPPPGLLLTPPSNQTPVLIGASSPQLRLTGQGCLGPRPCLVPCRQPL